MLRSSLSVTCRSILDCYKRSHVLLTKKKLGGVCANPCYVSLKEPIEASSYG